MVEGEGRSGGTQIGHVKAHDGFAAVWASSLELGRTKPYAHKPQEIIISLPLRAAGVPTAGPLLISHWYWDFDDHAVSGGKGVKCGLGWRTGGADA